MFWLEEVLNEMRYEKVCFARKQGPIFIEL